VTAVRVGQVQTVLGLIPPEQMGITMMHEHLLIDFRCRLEPVEEVSRVTLMEAKVTPERRVELLYDSYGNSDNLLLADEAEMATEALAFRNAGGGTIVDCTTRGLGRDPAALRRISIATGLHVSMGAGYYVYLAHPADMDLRSEDALCAEFVHDIEQGVGDSGIKCGHIGEIGCEQQTPNEMKVVRAAARAQRATGAMLNIHQEYLITGTSGHAIADAIEASGGDLRRTVFSHMDGSEDDFGYQESLLRRGITIEYDTFGWEAYLASYDMQAPSDASRIRGIARLAEAGWINQVVLAQDICMKVMMVKYGGWGFGHILERILPRFRKVGLAEEQIQALLVDNPRRLLPFVAPPV
jgi:phosphotriesterase-related protein